MGLLGAGLSACTYSWEVGGGGAGGGTTTTASSGGAGGATTSSAPDCIALGKAVVTARIAAQACSYAGAQAQGECADKVVDECGCAAFVKDGASAQAGDFSDAVAAWDAAGCTRSCASCSPLTVGACLQNVSVIHCVP